MLMYVRKRGFTLVELLVVISIIALLLGIMVPVLNAARARARTTVCATNLRNYGPALIMYAQDNSDKTPFMVSWLYSQATLSKGEDSKRCPLGCRWHYDKDTPDGSLWPYLKDKNVHLCPAFRTYAIVTKCVNDSSHSRNMPFNPLYSYAMNWHLGFDWTSYLSGQTMVVKGKTVSITYGQEITIRLSKVTRPTQCFAFSEENTWSVLHRRDDGSKIYSWNVLNDNALWLNANSNSSNFPNDATDNFATYHNVNATTKNEGKANVVFVDGHVKLIRGLAGYDAYMEYGRPYFGHENSKGRGNPIW